MINRKVKGFTLVELLAVIVILAIILVIAVPKIMNTIKDATKASLESSAKMVASQVENQYTVAQTLNKDFPSTGSCMEEWAGLNENDYSLCTYEITNNGKAKITLVGKGKFKNLNVYDATKSTATAVEGEYVDNRAFAYITRLLEEEDADLIEDDTDDKNIRYVGSTPNNYVYFNCDDTYNGNSYGTDEYDYDSACEIWRIIGVFDVAKTIGGRTEKRVKIIRDAFTDSGENAIQMSWDSSAENINDGAGINEWSQADLQKMLNGYYLGTTNTCKYCDAFDQGTCQNVCTNHITPLSNNAKKMIDDSIWSTRGVSYDSYTKKEMYEAEMTNDLTGKECSATNSDGSENTKCNDTIKRTKDWKGKIALPTISDWAYASVAEECTNVAENSGDCGNNNWLASDYNYWTKTPLVDAEKATVVWYVGGCTSGDDCASPKAVRPVTYLKSDIKIVDGDGDYYYPFVLK